MEDSTGDTTKIPIRKRQHEQADLAVFNVTVLQTFLSVHGALVVCCHPHCYKMFWYQLPTERTEMAGRESNSKATP